MTHAQALGVAILLMWFGCACLIIGSLVLGPPGARTGGNGSVGGMESR